MNIHPTILAINVVLAVAAAGSGDYALVLRPSGEVICTKSIETCETAVRALRARRWIPLNERATVDGECIPRPACFTERSQCIAGYNCR